MLEENLRRLAGEGSSDPIGKLVEKNYGYTSSMREYSMEEDVLHFVFR